MIVADVLTVRAKAIISPRWRAARPSPRSFRSAAGSTSAAAWRSAAATLIELAREFGTPAYVVAEDDLRARARPSWRPAQGRGQRAAARSSSPPRRFPARAVLALFARGGPVVRRRLRRRAAPRAERRLRSPSGSCCTATPSPSEELRAALRHRVGPIVIDNFDEIERLRELIAAGALEDPARADAPADSRCSCGSPRTWRGETHEKISTGQADSKFGFSMDQAPRALERGRRGRGAEAAGRARPHRLAAARARAVRRAPRAPSRASASSPCGTSAAASGCATPRTSSRRPRSRSTSRRSSRRPGRARPATPALLIEPGRALCANARVTLYTVESVKHNVSRWVAVDGGMSDNLRPMLYGSRYEAHVADRLGGSTACVLAGKHCESGDVIVREALLDDPRPGDVVVTPATGAYGYAMANNYNGVPRPPVDLLPRRRRARGRAARELRGPARPRCPLSASVPGSACSATAPSAAAFDELLARARRRDRALQRAPARHQRRADAQQRATSRRSSRAPS